ncbi:MAG: tetratricopeptide repeat protein [Proteobacteria bacterium]|nr:tetratricopeptide repeat protein [Pseudomonadota bacterium]
MSIVRAASAIKRNLGRLKIGVATAALAVNLAGCAQMPNFDLGLNLGASDEPKVSNISTSATTANTQADLEKATAYWGEENAKKPHDAKAAVNYAKNLKALGRKPQALSVLQAAYNFNSNDRDLLSEYGRLALELGQVSTAGQLLEKADDPAKPDWRIISARGTVLAKQNRFSEAIPLYEQASKLAPNQASIINNLAMAYVMNGQAARGKELLREALAKGSDDPRIKQNIELVMSLQGKSAAAAQPADAKVSRIATSSTEPSESQASQSAPAQSGSAPMTPQLRTGTSSSDYKFAPVPVSEDWNKALPMEGGDNTETPTSPGRQSSRRPVDADKIIRAAMKAEEAKTASAR